MKFLFCAALVVVLAQAHATSLSLNTQFAGFKHTHSKKYADAFEEVKKTLIEACKCLICYYIFLKSYEIVRRKYSFFFQAYRKGIFASNLAKISQHNEEYARGEHSWKMGVTQFADLTHNEFMEMLTLRVPANANAIKPYQMQSKVMATNVDWRDQVNSPPFYSTNSL